LGTRLGQGPVGAAGSGRAGNCCPSSRFDANQKDHSRVLLKQRPEKVSELIAYMTTIAMASVKYKWPSRPELQTGCCRKPFLILGKSRS